MGWPAKRGDTGHSPVGSAFFIKKGGRQNVTCRHTARPGFHAASWRLGLRGSLTQPIGAVGAYGNSVSAVTGIPRSPFRRRTRRPLGVGARLKERRERTRRLSRGQAQWWREHEKKKKTN